MVPVKRSSTICLSMKDLAMRQLNFESPQQKDTDLLVKSPSSKGVGAKTAEEQNVCRQVCQTSIIDGNVEGGDGSSTPSSDEEIAGEMDGRYLRYCRRRLESCAVAQPAGRRPLCEAQALLRC